MTMKIQDDCIACGACVPDCPTESITEGDGTLYVIDQTTCVECEGHFDSPKCVSVCPVDCIVKAYLLYRTRYGYNANNLILTFGAGCNSRSVVQPTSLFRYIAFPAGKTCIIW